MAGTRKGTYKITNWREYNESLVQRGSVTFWFSEDVVAQWHHPNTRSKVGHPFVYSDTAVECLLVLRELFQLPYRQTEGLGRSLVKLMEISLDIPDYTSLAKRAAKMEVSLDVAGTPDRSTWLPIAPGLKVFGEGEWKMRKHGKTKRRTWRKLHLAINPATAGDRGGNPDRKQLRRCGPSGPSAGPDLRLDGCLLRRRRVRQMESLRNPREPQDEGDYSAATQREDFAARQFQQPPAVPGRSDSGNPPPWPQALEGTYGYHRRSLSETAMHRMKCCFGDHLKNRLIPNQRTEARLRSKILNKFTRLGLPEFQWS